MSFTFEPVTKHPGMCAIQNSGAGVYPQERETVAVLERLEGFWVHLPLAFLPSSRSWRVGPGEAACFGLRRRVWTASADRPACPRVAPVPANKTRKRRNVPTAVRASNNSKRTSENSRSVTIFNRCFLALIFSIVVERRTSWFVMCRNRLWAVGRILLERLQTSESWRF